MEMKMAIKQNMIKCDIDEAGKMITMLEQARDAKGEWEVMKKESFSFDALPETSQAFCALYGLRAVLADRTSDAKANGVNKLEWMKEVYATLLAGVTRRAAKVSGPDRALVQLIVDLKGCSTLEAEAALKAIGKDGMEKLTEKYAKELAAIRAAAGAATDIDLGDLI